MDIFIIIIYIWFLCGIVSAGIYFWDEWRKGWIGDFYWLEDGVFYLLCILLGIASLFATIFSILRD